MSDLLHQIRSLRGPILVTGAAGFVGANLFHMLAGHRQDVFAVVRREKGWRLADVDDQRVISADLNDPVQVKNLVETIVPKTVFDCVAYGAYSYEEDAKLIHQTNYQSIVTLVSALSKHSLAAFVHAGSSSEYGRNCAAPREDAACEPNSDYALSKLAASNYLQFMGLTRQFPCVNLRLYSVYGPLEDTSRLIPNLLRQAVQGKLPPFVDSRTSRDFVHIDDVCAAFVVAAAKMNPGLYGAVFNIGSGKKITIGELAEITRDLFDITETPHFGTMQQRKWDLPDWYSDPGKALQELGWEATTTLSDGLSNMAEWVKTLTADSFMQNSKKTGTARKRSISAVIACYKDAEAIPIMHRRLTDTFRKLGIEYEIIFVNDCSPDNSAEVILELSKSDPAVLGINHSRNFGSQMAFRSGMELSTKDAVVLLDGDLQDPPELIAQFYAQWESGWDVVYGRRIKRDMPWHWGLMYKLFYRLFALFSYIRIPLDAGDFSLIDRRVVSWLLTCPERDLFMRGLRAYVGFRQTGVDYIRPDRMFGRSTNSLMKNIDWAKKGIFSFSNTPLTLLTSIGVVSLICSTIVALVTVVLRLLMPELAPKGVTTLLVAILIFGSFNLFAIGMVGEYVAKIMSEVKGRPRLIRTALIRNGEVALLSANDRSTS
jgi:nucleoside-diphosphate-sugar epimerase/glycosyltransferase involved in cell wall biosynthesis